MVTRTWSHYSQAIFDAYASGTENIIVQACPGAGKTTNAEHVWGLDDKPTVYLVFNKHNQLEARGKLRDKPGSAVLTLNGLGHRAIMNTFGQHVELDRDKVIKLVRRHMGPVWKSGQGLTPSAVREREWMLARAVATAKICDLGEGLLPETYEHMLDTYDLEEYPGMHSDILEILGISDAMTDVIDFNDQIRLPALYQCDMPEYHTVIGDEVQDFSPIQALMVSKLQAKRYLLIGDTRQSIYGFRGAMLNSMFYLRSAFNCRELPLSITYRCAISIVREAATIWPGSIEPWVQSPVGTVSTLLPYNPYADPDTLILCRCNAPLITMAFDLLRDGIACHVRGRDIGDGLVKLIHKMECNTVRDLIDNLAIWKETELYKASLKENDDKAQSVNDKFDSAMLFINRCHLNDPPQKVIDSINAMFAQGRGLCLSTVHKAKGLEAHSAYLLNYGLYDHFANRAKHAWQQEQERNIKYVAVTRAKRNLVYM